MKVKWIIFKGNTVKALKSLGEIYKKPSTYVLFLLISSLFVLLIKISTTLSLYWTLLNSSYLSILDKLGTLRDAYIEGVTMPDIIFVSILQGFTIAVLIQTIRKLRHSDVKAVGATGFVSVITLIGLGCPSCGTSIISPLILTFFASSAVSVASAISNVILVLAVVLNLYSIRRLGVVYADA
jgi:hypothetical protein